MTIEKAVYCLHYALFVVKYGLPRRLQRFAMAEEIGRLIAVKKIKRLTIRTAWLAMTKKYAYIYAKMA
ncbi:MAG: hypothetical protein LBB59_07850 [Campylobacteraceae bacterium]|nr:hypothetical protein [Campylobacteraceae bacterium]